MFISACQVITEYKLQAKQCAYVHSMTFMITEYFYHIRFEYVTFNIIYSCNIIAAVYLSVVNTQTQQAHTAMPRESSLSIFP